MANRHLLRSIAMQTLFEWDVRSDGDSSGESMRESNIEALHILHRNVDEFAPGVEDTVYIEGLINGVLEKREKLDEIIEKAAPDWPINKIAVVDRNILRLGLYELLFADRKEVPPKVAINEAIELAKSFSGVSSGRFVNGVLGSVYREIGEPGKDQRSKRIKDIPFEEMPIETLAGAVVYGLNGDKLELALVHDIFGHWTLSKGHVDEGQTVEESIKEDVLEEMGLDVLVEEELGNNEYVAADPEKGKIRKQVVYYLAKAEEYKEIAVPEEKGGLDDGRWFGLEDIVELNFYDDILPIVTKAVNILLERKPKE